MRIEFRCEHCQTLLRTTPDKAGLRAKCPSCGFFVRTPVVDAPDDVAANDWKEDDSDRFAKGENRLPGEATSAAEDPFSRHFGGAPPTALVRPVTEPPVPCPFCAEPIAPRTRRCPFCQEELHSAGVLQRTSTAGKRRAAPVSGPAVTSLIFGILSLLTFCAWFFSVPLGIVAILLGGFGLSQTKTGEYKGRGLAVAGTLLGTAGLLLGIAMFFVIVRPGGRRRFPF